MPLLHAPIITLFTAGLLGLVFIVLGVRVVMARMSGKVMLGHGDTEVGPLFVAIRAHGNFAEYVPLCLGLLGLLELEAGPTPLVKALAGVLVLARIAHPVGLVLPAPNPLRAGGFIGTMLVLAVASLAAVIAALHH